MQIRKMPSLAEFLETDDSRELISLFREQSLSAGQIIGSDEVDQILIVRRGRVRVYLATEERELSLNYLVPGDVFSTHTRAQLRAQDDSVVLLAQRHLIARELASYPSLQEAVVRVLAATLSQSMTLIEDLAFHQVHARLARYLVRWLHRHKVPCAVGAKIQLDLSMEEIATLLGTTRQTASTELNAMMREGAIARKDRRQITVVSPEKLLQWAGENDVAFHASVS
ncbi:Crp/Fnr family transcriptional regulator [Thalassospira sp. MA62]|nr:Crp/Fnr family transcriptional regulator [Thalassospira sp. MA62]